MRRSFASKTAIVSAAVTSVVLGGVAILPAAADSGTGEQSSSQSDMAQMHEHMTNDHPGMAQMHELMMDGNPGMARMRELMMQGNPGMAEMHELMRSRTQHDHR